MAAKEITTEDIHFKMHYFNSGTWKTKFGKWLAKKCKQSKENTVILKSNDYIFSIKLEKE